MAPVLSAGIWDKRRLVLLGHPTYVTDRDVSRIFRIPKRGCVVGRALQLKNHCHYSSESICLCIIIVCAAWIAEMLDNARWAYEKSCITNVIELKLVVPKHKSTMPSHEKLLPLLHTLPFLLQNDPCARC